METRAYHESYLRAAMTALGDMLDYAVNDCGRDIDAFFDRFLVSPVCLAFERGEARVVLGMSGVELAREVMRTVEGLDDAPPSRAAFSRSPAFWCGWALAYCQWRSCWRFGEICRAIPCSALVALYPALHEADIEVVYDRVAERMRAAFPGTRLSRLRAAAGLTQRALAARSGVGLRSIQMYEQRRKDINRAEARSIRSLAMALGCQMEDVLEAARGGGR